MKNKQPYVFLLFCANVNLQTVKLSGYFTVKKLNIFFYTFQIL